jgi:hypothetical protein
MERLQGTRNEEVAAKMPNMASAPGVGAANYDLEQNVYIQTELADLPKQIVFKERVHLWLTIRVSAPHQS